MVNNGKVLVTGASGFVGRTLCASLVANEYETVALSRQNPVRQMTGVTSAFNLDLTNANLECLPPVNCIVHLAGLAHLSAANSRNTIEEYRRVNVDATLRLARWARDHGVNRFIFISSIGVNGNKSDRPFTEDSKPEPVDLYAISKYEAELELKKLFDGSCVELVIIRPPLVYGVNAPGNFSKLVKIVRSRLVLPLGSMKSKKSFVAIDNLVDLIITCIRHPSAAGEVFLAGDGEDVSTEELIRKVGKAKGVRVKLIPIPYSVLKFTASMFGRGNVIDKMYWPLQVDISKAKNVLNWKPLRTVDEAVFDALCEKSLKSKTGEGG